LEIIVKTSIHQYRKRSAERGHLSINV